MLKTNYKHKITLIIVFLIKIYNKKKLKRCKKILNIIYNY